MLYLYFKGPLNITCKINNEIVKNKTVNEANSVDLRCEVSHPGLIFTWKKINDTHEEFKGDQENITFNSIKRWDDGQYQVTVRDKLNCSIENATLNVIVNCKYNLICLIHIFFFSCA
jgi:hypothetical protein